MSQRKAKLGTTPAEATAPPARRARAQRTPAGDKIPKLARVLCVGTDPATRLTLRSVAPIGAMMFDHAETVTSAETALTSGEIDVLLVDHDTVGAEGLRLVQELSSAGMSIRSVVMSAKASLELSVESMRAGAIDILPKPLSVDETAARLRAAADHTVRLRRGEKKVQRLKRICRRLNSARQDANRQLDVLCNDLVNAYQELADQMSRVSLASEFSSLIRQELDVESLLRTTLEYLLTKTGATNAAVFLPTGQSDYSLGAYVNYDVPKATADVLLDHLADIVAPRFEDERGVIEINDTLTFDHLIGDGANWLRNSNIIVFTCVHENEPLAIAMLFRDKRNPFPADLMPKLELMRDLFAQQLGRVISIHNRHRPDHEWPGFDIDAGEEQDDDFGLTA